MRSSGGAIWLGETLTRRKPAGMGVGIYIPAASPRAGGDERPFVAGRACPHRTMQRSRPQPPAPGKPQPQNPGIQPQRERKLRPDPSSPKAGCNQSKTGGKLKKKLNRGFCCGHLREHKEELGCGTGVKS